MAAGRAPEAAARAATGTDAERFGELRLILCGRAVPAAFFAWLAFQQLQRVINDIGTLPKPLTTMALLDGPLPASLYLCFCVIPIVIYVRRPAPQARDGRMLPRALALGATLLVLIIGVLPAGTVVYAPSVWIRGLSTALSILAFSVIICALLCLRRNLSIIPEARRLVVGGPYRFIRHPLYAAEILATLAFAIVNATALVLAIQLPFVAMQLLRSGYEERLLRAVFPHYAIYASRTPRIIPFT